MDGASLARLRWRRRGAWMWPAFASLTLVDAVVGHALPPAGDGQTIVAAALLGCALNIGAVLLLARPLGTLLRSRRPHLPSEIARDYGGTVALAGVAATLLAVGIAHHHSVLADRQAQNEAVARAEAWIGDRAPAEFRRSLDQVSLLAIEPGRIYRACVAHGPRTFCVVVDNWLPFASSVRPAGSEPNWSLGEGTG